MRGWAVVAVAAIVAALSACSSGPSAATAPSTQATHSVSPDPVSTISYADAGRVCAAMNALEYSGSSKTSAASTAEQAYHVTAADVAQARKIRCPGN